MKNQRQKKQDSHDKAPFIPMLLQNILSGFNSRIRARRIMAITPELRSLHLAFANLLYLVVMIIIA